MKQFLKKIAKGTSFIMLSILFSTSFACAMIVEENTPIISMNKEKRIENFIQEQKKKLFTNLINPLISANDNNKIIDLLNEEKDIQEECNNFVTNLFNIQQDLLNTKIDSKITITDFPNNARDIEINSFIDIIYFLLKTNTHIPPMYIIYDFEKNNINNANYMEFLQLQNNTLMQTMVNLKEQNQIDRSEILKIVHFLSLVTYITTNIAKQNNNIDSNDKLLWVGKIIQLINSLWNALQNISEQHAPVAEAIATAMLNIVSKTQETNLIGTELYNNLDMIDSFSNKIKKIKNDQEQIDDSKSNNGIHFQKLMLFYLLQTKPYVLSQDDLKNVTSQILAEQLLLAQQLITEQPSGWFSSKFWIGLGIFTLTAVGVGYLGCFLGWWGGTKNSDTSQAPQNLTTAITQFGTKMLNVPEDMCQHDLGLICNTTQDFDNSKTLPYSQHTNSTNTLHCNNQGQCIDEKNIAIVNAKSNSANVADILTQEKQNIITPNLKHFCNITKHGDKCPELLNEYQEFLKSTYESGETDKMHCKGKFKDGITNVIRKSKVETPKNNKDALAKIQKDLVQDIKTGIINQIDQNIEKLNNLTIPGNISALNITTVQNLLKTLHTTKNNTLKDFHLDPNYVNTTQNNLEKTSVDIDKLQKTINSKIQVGYISNETNEIKWQTAKNNVETIEYPMIFYSIIKNNEIFNFKLITQKKDAVINAKNTNPSDYFMVTQAERPKDVRSLNDGITFKDDSELTKMYITIAEKELVNIINANKLFEN